jgi:hypothetical protein
LGSWSAYKNARQRNQWAAGSLAHAKDNLGRGQSSEEQVANAQSALLQMEFVASDALAKFYSAAARYVSSMHADPLIDGTNDN